MVGKLFGRVIQERLQVVAERVLPDSQCGFRKGRGCCDMIFVARQLLEKTREHHDSLFTLFVDLRKAYDSVPREALWQVLDKCGVPPRMLQVVKSLHQGMHAEVRVGGSLSASFEVRNGLRQGPFHAKNNCAQELSENIRKSRVTNSKCTLTQSHQSVASRRVGHACKSRN